MGEISELIDLINDFRDERDWRQFHNEKDLTISLNLEAAELLEKFQWKSSEKAIEKDLVGIKEELADVLIYALMLADNLDADPIELIRAKVIANAEHYPVDKAKGSSDKYTSFG